MRFLVTVSVLLIPSPQSCAQESEPSILKNKRLIANGIEMGFVVVSPRTEKVVAGAALAMDITFTSCSDATVLNPFWEATATLPGYVAVFNDQRRFVGYLVDNATPQTQESSR